MYQSRADRDQAASGLATGQVDLAGVQLIFPLLGWQQRRFAPPLLNQEECRGQANPNVNGWSNWSVSISRIGQKFSINLVFSINKIYVDLFHYILQLKFNTLQLNSPFEIALHPAHSVQISSLPLSSCDL